MKEEIDQVLLMVRCGLMKLKELDKEKVNHLNKLLNELLECIYSNNLDNLLLRISSLEISPNKRLLVVKIIEEMKIAKRIKGDDWYEGGKPKIKKVIRKY